MLFGGGGKLQIIILAWKTDLYFFFPCFPSLLSPLALLTFLCDLSLASSCFEMRTYTALSFLFSLDSRVSLTKTLLCIDLLWIFTRRFHFISTFINVLFIYPVVPSSIPIIIVFLLCRIILWSTDVYFVLHVVSLWIIRHLPYQRIPLYFLHFISENEMLYFLCTPFYRLMDEYGIDERG